MSPAERTASGAGASAAGAARQASQQQSAQQQPSPQTAGQQTVSQAQQRQQAARAAAGGAADALPRRVRLTLARLDPWSVTKLSFLLSVAVGIALVVATAVVWGVLDGMGVFSDLNGLLRDVVGGQVDFDLLDYVGFGKVISLATVVAVVDVVLLTALSTLLAFLYNVSAALVGGLHVTLSDD